jgi:5-methylcytosine-specific restriction endonuclease McrA
VIKYKLCAEGGCMTSVPRGTRRCVKHTMQVELTSTGRAKSGWDRTPSKRAREGRISGRPWRRIRDRVIERDVGLCQMCKAAGLIRAGNEVDHIDNDGPDDMDNLRLLCKQCHVVVTTEQSRAARSNRA